MHGHIKSLSINVFNLNFSVPDYVRYYVEITFLIAIAVISILNIIITMDILIIKYSNIGSRVFNKFRLNLIPIMFKFY